MQDVVLYAQIVDFVAEYHRLIFPELVKSWFKYWVPLQLVVENYKAWPLSLKKLLRRISTRDGCELSFSEWPLVL